MESTDATTWLHAVEFIDNTLSTLSSESAFDQRIEEVKQDLELQKKNLENQLLFLKSQNAESYEKKKEKVEEFTRSADLISTEIKSVLTETANHLLSSDGHAKKINNLLSNIKDVDWCSSYFNYVFQLEELSSVIQSSMLVENIEQAVGHFACLLLLGNEIKDSKCMHLFQYVQATVAYWYKILISSLTGEIEKSLQAFGWPFIVSSVKQSPPVNATQLKENFGFLVTLLMKIQVPSYMSDKIEPVFQISAHQQICLPMQFFLVPFKKRFLYHFYGNKKTNNIEKPEWYFTQVNLWLNDHRQFLVEKLQPIFFEAGYPEIDVLSEFTEGLSLLASEKLKCDLTQLLINNDGHNDQLVAHYVDEALAFHNEIFTNFPYRSSYSGCLDVLTDESVFKKWISVEKEFDDTASSNYDKIAVAENKNLIFQHLPDALRKMDFMFSMTDAWMSHTTSYDSGSNDMKIPQFAEHFLILMMTIQDRYIPLMKIECQLEFCQLQLFLIDDFRIRLFQIRKQLSTVTPTNQQVAENSKYISILNTVTHVGNVLKKWADDPFYIKLSYFKRKLEAKDIAADMFKSEDEIYAGMNDNDTINDDNSIRKTTTEEGNNPTTDASATEPSVLDGMIELYERMKAEMMTSVINLIVEDVKNKSKTYRRNKWLALPSHKEFLTLALSNTACSMLRSLKEHLDNMETLLNTSLFTILWQSVAALLNDHIFDNVICVNHFNEGGAMQLNFDMNRNLFPIFSHYTKKPKNFFKSIKEACTVLTLSPGSALLIRDVLRRALHPSESNVEVSDPISALHDIGIFKLDPEQVEFLISLRIDLQQS